MLANPLILAKHLWMFLDEICRNFENYFSWIHFAAGQDDVSLILFLFQFNLGNYDILWFWALCKNLFCPYILSKLFRLLKIYNARFVNQHSWSKKKERKVSLKGMKREKRMRKAYYFLFFENYYFALYIQ